MTEYILYFLASANVLAAIITIADKIKAKNEQWRIPEAVLIFIALIGGALFEYITMKLIRHKTKHKKFMLGLPAIMLLHLLIILLILLLK